MNLAFLLAWLMGHARIALGQDRGVNEQNQTLPDWAAIC